MIRLNNYTMMEKNEIQPKKRAQKLGKVIIAIESLMPKTPIRKKKKKQKCYLKIASETLVTNRQKKFYFHRTDVAQIESRPNSGGIIFSRCFRTVLCNLSLFFFLFLVAKAHRLNSPLKTNDYTVVARKT